MTNPIIDERVTVAKRGRRWLWQVWRLYSQEGGFDRWTVVAKGRRRKRAAAVRAGQNAISREVASQTSQ